MTAVELLTVQPVVPADCTEYVIALARLLDARASGVTVPMLSGLEVFVTGQVMSCPSTKVNVKSANPLW